MGNILTNMVRFKSDGLVGMWGHTFDADGDIEWQFQIVSRSGDVYLLNLHSWKDGRPTHIMAMNRAKLLGLKLYQSSQSLNVALDEYKAARQIAHREPPALSLVKTS